MIGKNTNGDEIQFHASLLAFLSLSSATFIVRVFIYIIYRYERCSTFVPTRLFVVDPVKTVVRRFFRKRFLRAYTSFPVFVYIYLT